MGKMNPLKWLIPILSWLVIGVLILFVVAVLGGIVFIAKTALATIFYPITWLIGKMETK